MKNKITERLKKLNKPQQNLIFGLGLAGILLVAFANFTWGEGGVTPAMATAEQTKQQQLVGYEEKLEQRLETILGSMDGVGRVRVMVTLDSGYGYEYAKENKTGNDLLSDYKAEDAQKTQEKNTSEENYVMVDAGGGGKKPLITKELEPSVKGVVVVCQGGGDMVIVAKVVETVGVATGVSANRISVSTMETAAP